MAPPHRLAATPINSRAQRAQPYPAARPPHSQQFVNRHPELCYAPRMMPTPLPEDTQPGWRPSPHTSYPSALATTRGGMSANGALHLSTTAQQYPWGGPNANVPPDYYLVAHPTLNVTAPPPYPIAAPSNQPSRVLPVARSEPVPIPKPREPSSPPTPEATPPRPAVTSRRQPVSAGYAQHGRSPTT